MQNLGVDLSPTKLIKRSTGILLNAAIQEQSDGKNTLFVFCCISVMFYKAKLLLHYKSKALHIAVVAK